MRASTNCDDFDAACLSRRHERECHRFAFPTAEALSFYHLVQRFFFSGVGWDGTCRGDVAHARRLCVNVATVMQLEPARPVLKGASSGTLWPTLGYALSPAPLSALRFARLYPNEHTHRWSKSKQGAPYTCIWFFTCTAQLAVRSYAWASTVLRTRSSPPCSLAMCSVSPETAERVRKYVDEVSTNHLVETDDIVCPAGHGAEHVHLNEAVWNARLRQPHSRGFDPVVFNCDSCGSSYKLFEVVRAAMRHAQERLGHPVPVRGHMEGDLSFEDFEQFRMNAEPEFNATHVRQAVPQGIVVPTGTF